MENEYNFQTLLETNEKFIHQYKSNSLMIFVTSNNITDKEIRIKLLSVLQTFSNYFQKAVILRYALNDNAHFSFIIKEHLKEEFLHNEELLQDQK